jgi:ABC-2 type transport system ATP-binding protein/lipopolysaccharide transport system ATP-binding protein
VKFFKTGKFSYSSEFPALRDVSFTVSRGEVFGIIGSNGAGKSTLLKVIAGVLPPSAGEVQVNGRIDTLIQLGAGFDAELTATENIFLYGSLHGRSKREIEGSVAGILEFAELTEFANTPIKYFSSGMYARLGFSCAIESSPDILLVDEVLAVGDERFSKKCRKVFHDFLADGRTVIMVSHSLTQLAEDADEILVLSKGEVAYIGEPAEALRVYRDPDYKTRLSAEQGRHPA